MLAIYQRLDQLKQQMLVLAHDPIRAEYARLDHLFKREYNQLQQHHQNERQKRKLLRQSLTEAEQKDLDRVSQSQKRARKQLKEKWQAVLQPLEEEIRRLDRQLYDLRQEYKLQSQLLQKQLSHVSLTGEEKTLEVVYHDRDLIVVNKPSGLLSVPGRYIQGQDCVYHQLKQQLQTEEVFVVHRLDQDTSGLLLFALNLESRHYLTKAWQNHLVQKIYEALLPAPVDTDRGVIALPLAADPDRAPRQQVTMSGKPSLTTYEVVANSPGTTRLQLQPHTGRTHQLRVHCLAHFGIPILGDRLYGCQQGAPRLYLHARELHFPHPRSGAMLAVRQPSPF